MAEFFGKTATGETVERIVIRDHDLTASIITYGAALQDLRLDAFDYPLVLGFDNLQAYQHHPGYFGANVGRVANRIANAKTRINGKFHQFDKNELNRHTLHGGQDGIGRQVWNISDYGKNYTRLDTRLPDGHMGFPGTLDISLTYRIVDTPDLGPGLELEYFATSDRDTLCNIAHHSYFNLDGGPSVLNHKLQIDAENYLPVNNEQIPTGEIKPVAGTDFDFRSPKTLKNPDHPNGFDHNFCLSKRKTELGKVASLTGGKNHLTMEIATTETGLQIYNGAGTKSLDRGLLGKPYQKYAGIALEAQAWPDAPNHDHFPDIVLKADAQYHQITRFSFHQHEEPDG